MNNPTIKLSSRLRSFVFPFYSLTQLALILVIYLLVWIIAKFLMGKLADVSVISIFTSLGLAAGLYVSCIKSSGSVMRLAKDTISFSRVLELIETYIKFEKIVDKPGYVQFKPSFKNYMNYLVYFDFYEINVTDRVDYVEVSAPLLVNQSLRRKIIAL